MPTEVSLTVVNPELKNNYKKATVLVEDETLIKALFPNGKVTENELASIQEVARKSGDMGVLEASDLNPTQKLALAKVNGYDEYYDIKLSKDGKYYEVTIKETGMFTPDPKACNIKRDFGLKENVLLNNNMNYMIDNAEPGSSADGRNTDYDQVKFPAGTVIKLPVDETSFEAGTSGFWRRIFS